MLLTRHACPCVASCALLLLVPAGCAGTYESAVRTDLERAARTLGPAPGEARETPTPLGPALSDYLVYAAERHPDLRASYGRWRASVHRISPARRLPDPAVDFGLFVWNSGENAGVVPARASIRQEFPWPTALSAGADAAAAEARALSQRFEALLLDLRQQVTEAYFRLWLLRETRTIQQEQLEILRWLSQSTLGQIATGAATLADQQQIDLIAARLEDAIAGLDQQERAAEAQVRAVVGAPPGAETPTEGAPPAVTLPAEADAALEKAALDHPFIASFALMGEASDALARREAAGRFPGFAVGVEWLRMPGEMGTSAVVPNVGVRLPLWQGSYREGIRAAQADASAQRAEGEGAALRAQAALAEALSVVRDAHRRAALNEHTLLPQAEAAYASVLGAYTTSRSSIAESVLAQQQLLEIRLDLAQARADHAVAWARLEQVVGRTVERAAVSSSGPSSEPPSMQPTEQVSGQGKDPITAPSTERGASLRGGQHD